VTQVLQGMVTGGEMNPIGGFGPVPDRGGTSACQRTITGAGFRAHHDQLRRHAQLHLANLS